MSEQYGTLTITMEVDVPDLTSEAFRTRKVTVVKTYLPRSMAEGYVKKFEQSNPGLSRADCRATFAPEPEWITI